MPQFCSACCSEAAIPDQLDRYDVWHVELDVYPDLFAGYFVQHLCVDPTGPGPSVDFLADMSQTKRARESFFVVGIQRNEFDFCGGATPDDFPGEVSDLIDDYFPLNSIYSLTDSANDDGK